MKIQKKHAGYNWLYADAVASGNTAKWEKAHQKALGCRARFSNQGIGSLEDSRTDMQGWIKESIDTYGYELCCLVVASQVNFSINEGRYSSDVKEWAERFQFPPEANGRERNAYWAKAHPATLNLVAKNLIRMEPEYTKRPPRMGK